MTRTLLGLTFAAGAYAIYASGFWMYLYFFFWVAVLSVLPIGR